MTDTLDTHGVQFCWCPPMDDPNDPDQHETVCAHAAFVEQWQRRQPPVAVFRQRQPSPGCYEASFGWVHVKPGCRCPR